MYALAQATATPDARQQMAEAMEEMVIMMIGLAAFVMLFMIAAPVVGSLFQAFSNRVRRAKIAPLPTVGIISAVLTEALEDDAECVACGADTVRGERRRWVRAFVLFGFAVYRYDGGANAYCYDCAQDDVVLSQEVPA